ncbi:MAG: TrmH family RNA methyltransferase [Cyclobacteriaceae bacterium]|jgi:TrmH family RNA methyltransferase
MVSKNQSKFIKSLKIKKYRNLERCFLVEGRKNVLELIYSEFDIRWIIGTREFIAANELKFKKIPREHILEASASVLSDLGTFSSNQDCIAVAEMKDNDILNFSMTKHLFVLDGVGDPGNLGTIIRTLDWFGYDQLVCSLDTAEFYNPKVINSTMGSFGRVKVFYTELEIFLDNYKSVKKYGADMEGIDPTSITPLGKPVMIIMGSESHGISKTVTSHLDQKISIPRIGRAESLNVGIATGILAYLFSK